MVAGCSPPQEEQASVGQTAINPVDGDTVDGDTVDGDTVDISRIVIDTSVFEGFDPSDIEPNLIKHGLVDIRKLDSTIVVDLRYSTTNNFMGVDVYGDFNKCYLQPEVAEKLVLAQLFLRSKVPNYSLIVFDAIRPRSVQRLMWNAVQLPPKQKSKFLSNPDGGSLHNFGAAVDIGIVDVYGDEMDMGTPYDHLGPLAYPRLEKKMLEQGRLSKKQLRNREFLRDVMRKSGFTPITTEWWHFNSCSRKQAYQKYEMVE